jgi:hypothetical protein
MTKIASKVVFTTVNQAVSPSTPGLGVIYVIGPTDMGPVKDPSQLILTKAQYRTLFGNEVSDNPFPSYVMRLLENGSRIRVCRVPNADSQYSQLEVFDEVDNLIFTLKAKYPGSYYDAIRVSLVEDQDNLANNILLIGLGNIEEQYIFARPGASTSPPYDYLLELETNSQLVDVIYEDLSDVNTVTNLVEFNGETLSGGNSGTSPDLDSYTGAVESFNPYDDGIVLLAPNVGLNESDEQALVNLLATGASLRQDLIAIHSVPVNKTDHSDIITWLVGITLPENPKFLMFTLGGIKVLSGGEIKTFPESLDVASKVASQYNAEPWKSPSGLNRGVLSGVMGIVNNFGTPALVDELDLITEAGGNPVIRKNNQVVLWNAYTMAPGSSQEKFLTVVLLEIYLKRMLVPVLERYLAEPNTPQTWQNIYFQVNPRLQGLVESQAFYDYEWMGDQFVTDMQMLQINTPEEVQAGNYKVVLEATLVSPIVKIHLEFVKKSLTINTQ